MVGFFRHTIIASAPRAGLLCLQFALLYAAGMKHGVNPFLVMGLAWHESGWQSSVVSSAGAVGIMQVMPATAAVDGPELLGRSVNLYDPGDNIDITFMRSGKAVHSQTSLPTK